MSIYAVITLGYGQGVKFLPTIGYLLGSMSPDNDTGHGSYIYSPKRFKEYESDEAEEEKIKRDKTELEKLESVLKETERKKALAAESRRLASQRNALKRALELEALEYEYLNEIARLLMVRDAIMRRIKAQEEELFIRIAVKKRRFRAVA